MARHTDPEKQYRVSGFVSGKYRYAGTQPRVIDPKTGKLKYKHIILGTLSDEKKFIPNKIYINLPQEERNKLQFPKDWDLSEINKIVTLDKINTNYTIKDDIKQIKENQNDSLLYGDVWLLENIAKKNNLYNDLLEIFNNDIEKVQEILTIAYFYICRTDSLNNIIYWQNIAKTPTKTPLNSSLIAELTHSISEKNRCDLINLRAKRAKKDEIYVIYSTTKSTYKSNLLNIQSDINKDYLDFSQTVEIVAYEPNSYEPIYYKTFFGDISDVTILESILYDLKKINFNNIVIITDRFYDNEKNLELFLERNQKIITKTKINNKYILEKVETLGDFNNNFKKMKYDKNSKIFYKQYSLYYEIKKDDKEKIKMFKYNLYLNPMERAEKINSIYKEIYREEDNINYIKENKIKIKYLEKYFNIKYSDDDTIYDYKINEDIINNEIKLCGFYYNTTFGVDFNSIKSNYLYNLIGEQEKYFKKVKYIIEDDWKKYSSGSKESGILFILFISKILKSYIINNISDDIRKKFQSVEGIVSEMRWIQYVQHSGVNPFITPFTSSQRLISEDLGFTVPEGCSPEH